jgi:phosphoserine phosphatase
MKYVLTLAAATIEAFPVETAQRVHEGLSDSGAAVQPLHWLGPAACDLVFDGIDPAAAETIARTILGESAIDVLTQDVATRRKRLLIADMESTLIHQELLDELAELKGIRLQIAGITARAMNGEIDFKQALEERVGLLAGLPVAALHDTWERVTLMPGAKLLVNTMRRRGCRTILVSGGFTLFTGKLRERLGFDADHGNQLELERGVMTGRLVHPIQDRYSKLAVLEQELRDGDLSPIDVVAVGDGANDIPMLNAAGFGVAYHAKPTVRAAAKFRIDHADLSALLYAQGFRREEFRSE